MLYILYNIIVLEFSVLSSNIIKNKIKIKNKNKKEK